MFGGEKKMWAKALALAVFVFSFVFADPLIIIKMFMLGDAAETRLAFLCLWFFIWLILKMWDSDKEFWEDMHRDKSDD